MLEVYQDDIVAGLIKKGYSVGLASSGNITINHENQVSAVIALTIFKIDSPDALVKEIYAEVADICTEMKGYFYSIVIAESTNATWSGSNIFMKEVKKVPQLPPTSDEKKSNKLN